MTRSHKIAVQEHGAATQTALRAIKALALAAPLVAFGVSSATTWRRASRRSIARRSSTPRSW
ncbi:hypothetical protein [Piscinibacter sp. XHJ-5]|uniref:hypothetical protein n=1 Tax=Piscinibacter sp. XHJ-5 TaxID=3037797 RepID=UPI002452FA40|nr:hypothetical protein [Piscinibacter sp. XHJ-5]